LHDCAHPFARGRIYIGVIVNDARDRRTRDAGVLGNFKNRKMIGHRGQTIGSRTECAGRARLVRDGHSNRPAERGREWKYGRSYWERSHNMANLWACQEELACKFRALEDKCALLNEGVVFFSPRLHLHETILEKSDSNSQVESPHRMDFIQCNDAPCPDVREALVTNTVLEHHTS